MHLFSPCVAVLLLAGIVLGDVAVTDKEKSVLCYKCVGDRNHCLKTYDTCRGKACRRSSLIDGDLFRLECLDDLDEGIVMGIRRENSEEILTCATDRCNSATSTSGGIRLLSSAAIVFSALVAFCSCF